MISDPLIAVPVLIGLCALLWGAMGGLNWRRLFRRRAFGGVRWARLKDLRKAGLTKSGGLFLGRTRRRDLYRRGEGHLLTIGGTGGGKSSGLVVPALLNLTEGSVIVTDPSGELTAMTKRRRAELSKVVILNPFQSVFEKGTGLKYPDTGFNPMSIVDPELDTFKADCDALARYLMVTDRQESGSYWNDEGAEFLSLMIAAIILYEDDDLHDLTHLYRRVRDSADGIGQWLEYVSEKNHPALCDEAERFIDIILNAKPQWSGIVSKAALATKRYAPSTPLGEHVKKNGFDAHDLKREDVTVYLLVPASQLATALPWMNTLIGVFGIAIGRPSEQRPVTLLIDEAPSLGYLPDLIPFMGQFRKAGLRAWIFTQTQSQLAAPDLYGQEGFKAINGLCAVKQFFAIGEPEVRQMVSDLCGQNTVSNISANTGGASISDVGVPLIRPEEVRGLKTWQQVIVIDGMTNPIKGWLMPYFKRKAWNAMADPNPYRQKDD